MLNPLIQALPSYIHIKVISITYAFGYAQKMWNLLNSPSNFYIKAYSKSLENEGLTKYKGGEVNLCPNKAVLSTFYNHNFEP